MSRSDETAPRVTDAGFPHVESGRLPHLEACRRGVARSRLNGTSSGAAHIHCVSTPGPPLHGSKRIERMDSDRFRLALNVVGPARGESAGGARE